jgi:hypothetical protein
MRLAAVVAVLMCATLSSVVCTVSPGQKQALVDMFNECGGASWSFWAPYNPPWNLTTDPCDDAWSDVECDPHNTTIVYVALRIFRLFQKVTAWMLRNQIGLDCRLHSRFFLRSLLVFLLLSPSEAYNLQV